MKPRIVFRNLGPFGARSTNAQFRRRFHWPITAAHHAHALSFVVLDVEAIVERLRVHAWALPMSVVRELQARIAPELARRAKSARRAELRLEERAWS